MIQLVMLWLVTNVFYKMFYKNSFYTISVYYYIWPYSRWLTCMLQVLQLLVKIEKRRAFIAIMSYVPLMLTCHPIQANWIAVHHFLSWLTAVFTFTSYLILCLYNSLHASFQVHFHYVYLSVCQWQYNNCNAGFLSTTAIMRGPYAEKICKKKGWQC